MRRAGRGAVWWLAPLSLLSACTGVTEPRRVIPAGEEGVVLDPRIGVTVVPVEGWVKCAVAYDGVAICWQVTDSVTVR